MKLLYQKFRLFLLATILLIISTFKVNAQPPLFDQWESNMTTWGDYWGVYLQTYDPPTDGGMNEQQGTYYDAQRIYFQIADYTGQAEPWNAHAQEAERVYRAYLDNRWNYNNTIPYFVQGWRRFSHGIMMDAQRTADPISINGVIMLRDNGAYAYVLTSDSTSGWYYERLSREIAYMISAHINAEKIGHPRQEEALALYVTMAMNHLDEWITETYASPDSHRLAPFMVGLTAEALIEYYEWEIENERNPSDIFTHPSVTYIPTRTITQALQEIAHHMRYTATVESGVNAGKPMWVEDVGGTNYPFNDEGGTGYAALRYESINNARPSPTLSLLIAPLYAWVFKQTGEIDYINIGDQLWEGGVALADISWNTKIYNQNYRWSFDYVRWRIEGMEALNINEVVDNKFQIYPNPVKDILTIDNKGELIKNCKIYNTIGQVVQSSSSFDESKIDISHLKSGVYFLKVVMNQKETTVKFIKE
ncbi:MAG: T9SS type A sorting domain-containing protein [Cyclobacteriaceae bacterium]|nr:T9SS type A sorting domain-containing protein [Cyclobacteriaceae bacterium]